MDYVVEVKEAQPKHIDEDIRVTIWKGSGYEILNTLCTSRTSNRSLSSKLKV